jgi:hypothetical protein
MEARPNCRYCLVLGMNPGELYWGVSGGVDGGREKKGRGKERRGVFEGGRKGEMEGKEEVNTRVRW